MLILLIFAFISGFVTILAPCIWPLLPIILSASSTGGKSKPLGITLGILLSFGFLTLALSFILKIFPFDPNILRIVSVVIIGFLGLSLFLPALRDRLEAAVSRLSGKINISGQSKSTGFGSGFLTGASLGIIWTPCGGPIFASIATLAALQSVSFGVILITLFYMLGLAGPLFLFTSLGNKIFTQSKKLSPYLGKIQQIFGLVMILTALAIATNFDKTIQNKLLDLFPNLNQFFANVDNTPQVIQQLQTLKNQNNSTSNLTNGDLFNASYLAPEIKGITNWLNTDKPLNLADLKGKVVLIDFWTYTCINCIRTLPHVATWYDKYQDDGFVVIGVHTPEFEFEKNTQNVTDAIKRFNIHYPVAQDNNYQTWNQFSNQYWPAEYLIDSSGNVRRVEFGEGEYDQMEMAIRTLLQQSGQKISSSLDTQPDQTPQNRISPETYFGSKRAEFFYPDGSLSNGQSNFQINNNLPLNSFSLGGSWSISPEYALSSPSSTLNYHFYASKVYLIAKTTSSGSVHIKISLDGKTLDKTQSGQDVKDGVTTVDSDRLYSIIDLKNQSSDHILNLEFDGPTQIYTFTFG